MRIETFENTISVEEYIEKYVNVEEFLEYCKVCKNYNKIWACPSFDFDPIDYWKQYDNFYVIGKKIYSEGLTSESEWKEIYYAEKRKLSQFLFEKEKEKPGSISLCAGSCDICLNIGCTRITGGPCRNPDKMRYSIESLGGNVGLTADKLLGIELKWLNESTIPEYFVLVGGLLY